MNAVNADNEYQVIRYDMCSFLNVILVWFGMGQPAGGSGIPLASNHTGSHPIYSLIWSKSLQEILF